MNKITDNNFSLIEFDNIQLEPCNLFIYNYVSFINIQKDKNGIIKFKINKIDGLHYIISDENDIISCGLLNNKSNKFEDNFYFINIDYISKNNVLYLYLLISDNSKFQYNNNDETIQIINTLENSLFIRNINNNIKININTDILEKDKQIDIENYRKKYYSKYSEIIYFKNFAEELSYLLDKKIIIEYLNKLDCKPDNRFSSFEDTFYISFKIASGSKILIIARDDWSNTAYRFVKSLKINNTNALLLKINKHKFNYPLQGIIVSNIVQQNSYMIVNLNTNGYNLIRDITQGMEFICFHASVFFTYNNKNLNNIIKKKYIVCHGGTAYRNNKQKVNNYSESFIYKTIIQCPDLLGYGSKNEKLIYYPVDINYILPDYSFKHSEKLVFGHFPSTKSVKGTNQILEVLDPYIKSNKIIYIGVSKGKDSERLPWEKHLQRYKKCDIYIETFKPILHNNKFGEWGNTCLEASASGCIVLTNCIHLDKYIKEYNNNPSIFVSNTKNELIKNINLLLNLDREQILLFKKKSRQWVESFHSFQKCGERLLKYIYN